MEIVRTARLIRNEEEGTRESQTGKGRAEEKSKSCERHKVTGNGEGKVKERVHNELKVFVGSEIVVVVYSL